MRNAHRPGKNKPDPIIRPIKHHLFSLFETRQSPRTRLFSFHHINENKTRKATFRPFIACNKKETKSVYRLKLFYLTKRQKKLVCFGKTPKEIGMFSQYWCELWPMSMRRARWETRATFWLVEWQDEDPVWYGVYFWYLYISRMSADPWEECDFITMRRNHFMRWEESSYKKNWYRFSFHLWPLNLVVTRTVIWRWARFFYILSQWTRKFYKPFIFLHDFGMDPETNFFGMNPKTELFFKFWDGPRKLKNGDTFCGDKLCRSHESN